MFKPDWKKILFLCLIAIPNSLFTFGILFIINSIVTGRTIFISADLDKLFFLIIALSFGLNLFFQRKIVGFTFNLIYENEIRIFQALRQTSLKQLETIGPERIYGIVEDVRLFAYMPGFLSATLSALMSLIICLTYYFILSVKAALVVILLIGMLVLLYVVINKRLFKRVLSLRALNDTYFKVVDDAIKGFKELKMNTIKSHNLFEYFLGGNRREVRDLETGIGNRYLVLNLFSQYGLYLMMGIILFILPAVHLLQQKEVIPFVVILLFIIGPVSTLLGLQNYYTRAFVANRRIATFLEEMKNLPLNEIVHEPPTTLSEVSTLRFENMTYHYASRIGDSTFQLGPVDLNITKGETLFIIGGNGSGKSTFINCLTGLYKPTGGRIFLNDQEVGNDDQYYRNHMTAIFTDNHLFSRNYDNYSLEGNKKYERLLKVMKLDNVVADDRDESARRKFSKGQSKRMAMIFALMEDAPVLVLDEWAADQDPYFRKYFYEKLLPELKKQGKTIIAVTHDDAYFKYADRVIKFDYGKIVRDIQVNERPLETETLWEL